MSLSTGPHFRMTANGNHVEPIVYIKGQQVDFEEDLHHEFKGHRNLTKDDLPRVTQENGFRQPVSRNLCGFLNTGLGGIVYVGILDDGRVCGITLTEYQKHHVLLNVQDTFQRYDPPVDEKMYTVRFVPVVDPDLAEGGRVAQKTEFLDVGNLSEEPHTFRTATYCWCETEALARHNKGIMAQLYVVEIEIFPWNPDLKLAMTRDTPIHPLFLNEDGLCIIRRHGGLHQLTLPEIIEMTEAETRLYHETRLAQPVRDQRN